MYDALSRSTSIRRVLARHEQGAGLIGQGMSRVSGKPAVFFVTSGPGATNVLTCLADAKLDSIPMICITGQVPSSLIGAGGPQAAWAQWALACRQLLGQPWKSQNLLSYAILVMAAC